MTGSVRAIPEAATIVQAAVLHGPVVHAFSTRQGGVSRPPFDTLNLGQSVGDDPAAVQENRRRFFGRFGIEPDHVVRVKQVHGERVLVIDEPATRRPGFPFSLIHEPVEADATITNLPGLALVVSTADCVPILIQDPARRAVAAVHAGWRGTAARIAARAVEAMARTYGTRPADCRAAIGPAIRRCCYQVDRPVQEQLAAGVASGGRHLEADGPGYWRADLPGLNRAILLEAGLTGERIEDVGLCTACRRDLFFSHRADRGRTGRMMNFILLLPPAEPELPAEARQVREAEQNMSWEGGPPEQAATGEPFGEKR
ncbi:MAG: peptidoglycan editing factor PgeF [Candidatus Methylomirabilales bacterium]